MHYKLLLFDADETLFDFVKSQAFALKQSTLDHKITHPYSELERIYEDINTKIWQEFEEGLIKVADLKVDRFRRLFKTLGLDIDSSAFAKTYMRNLGSASYIYEGVPKLLHELEGKYRMAIITNGLTAVQSRRIRQSDIKEFFEEIVISEEITLVKPDPKIFDYTLEKLGHMDRKSVLMVGDNLKSDILGGINAGIDTCWLNAGGQKNVSDIHPTFEIQSVLDIQSILE